jgi:regulatory protein
MPIVTHIQVQKQNTGRVNIYLNHQYAFSTDMLNAARLRIGDRLSEKEVEVLVKADRYYRAYRFAVIYLSYRRRSRKELENHLWKKGFSKSLINRIIHRLIEEKSIDDCAFAKSWIENRIRFKPRSIFALRFELKQKGVSDDIIDPLLTDLRDEQLACLCVEHRLHLFRRMKGDEIKKKLFTMLKRRGFGYQKILGAYDYACMLLSEPE